MEPDQDGEFFIDRDPKHFDLILNYLRSVPTVPQIISQLNSLEFEEFKHEVEYYQISSLIEIVERETIPSFLPDFSGPNVSLDNKSKKLVKVAGGGAWNATALCSKSSKFAIRLLSVTNGSIMIGLAPKTFQKDSQIFNSCGWYYNIYDGTCYSQSGDSRRSFTSISPNRAVGTIIGIDWNQSTGAVSIFCNGQNMGVA